MTSVDLVWRLTEAGLDGLVAEARRLKRAVRGDRVTVSRKDFIPLTRLCCDVYTLPIRLTQTPTTYRRAVGAVRLMTQSNRRITSFATPWNFESPKLR
jgi:hypothetical protein